MLQNSKLEPTIIVIFGASGDLTSRKLAPALYNLFLDQQLPEIWAIVGVARSKIDDSTFRQRIREGIDRVSRRGAVKESIWTEFSGNISYLSEDVSDRASGSALQSRLIEIEEKWGLRANRVYYLAIPPTEMKLAADLFALQAQRAVATRGRFLVLLAGGETPRRTYEVLAQEPHRARIPWRQVHFFGEMNGVCPPMTRTETN